MKYIVAVSGGVDSMVLLDALFTDRLQELTSNSKFQIPNSDLVVAHFDHGIRSESAKDEAFVRGVASRCGLVYETERAQLGSGASEEQARRLRYDFLRRCCKKYNATLITAHHQGDISETMIINLIRGTGWRGLVSLDSDADILRPLLTVSKQMIHEYANRHNVIWREDSTNTDDKYLRNYVRNKLLKDRPDIQGQLLELYLKTKELKDNIATELQNNTRDFYKDDYYEVPRYFLIMSSPIVSREIIREILVNLDPDWHPTAQHIIRALHFTKTAKPGKQLNISKSLKVTAETAALRFQKCI